MNDRKGTIDLKCETFKYKEGSPFNVSLINVQHSTLHFHKSDIELVYCLRGTAEILCNHEHITLCEGQVFTIDYRDIHCIYSDEDNQLAIFHIDMNNVSKSREFLEYTYLGCQDITCNARQLPALNRVKKMLLATALIFFDDKYERTSMLQIAADNIIDILCGDFDLFNSLHSERIINEELHERMHSIIKYCQQNYNSKITMSNLARKIHINENYFSQFMRSSTYGSFRNMLGYIRSFEAQYLLLTTDYSNLTISHMCGFSNDKYLYKHFKSWWNKTPQEYRNWCREYSRTPEKIHYYTTKESREILEPYITLYFIETAFHENKR